MPILNIRDLGMAGVNSDVAPWELPPSTLSYGYNFRMSSGKIQSAGGISPVGGRLDDLIGHIAPTRDYNQNASFLACTGDDVFMYHQEQWVSIKGGLGFSNLDPVQWSSCSIGNVTFLNHPDYYPVYFTNTGVPADLELLPWHIGEETWQSVDKSCRVICAHKNFLFALGMQEGLDEYRDKVWWSHPAEPNGIPFSWRPTSEEPSSIAGYVNLGRGGAIVGGDSLRDSFVVYSEDAINTLDFTGDALGWRRRTISTSADLIGKEALVEVKGAHYFISRNDIMMFDGNSMQSLIHNRLKRQFTGNINLDAVHTSWATHNQPFNEIWFAVPTSNADYPDLAYVYNYRDNTWAARYLELEMAHGAFGERPFSDPRTWDGAKGEFDESRGSWGMGGERPFRGLMVGGSMLQAFDLDPGYRDTDFYKGYWEQIQKSWEDCVADTWESAKPPLMETLLSRVDIPVGGHETNTTITRIYPLVEGTAPIQVRVGSAQRAGGPIRWAGDFRTFMPGKDRKIDVRTTGETHAFEIKSDGMTFFDLTGMDIEFQMAGTR